MIFGQIPVVLRQKNLFFRCVSISINSKFTNKEIHKQTNSQTNRHLAVCTLTTLCRVQDGQDSDQDIQNSHQGGQNNHQDNQDSHQVNQEMELSKQEMELFL